MSSNYLSFMCVSMYSKYRYTKYLKCQIKFNISDSSCNNLITDLGKPCNRKDKGRDKRSAKCNKNTDELTGKDNLSIRYT